MIVSLVTLILQSSNLRGNKNTSSGICNSANAGSANYFLHCGVITNGNAGAN